MDEGSECVLPSAGVRCGCKRGCPLKHGAAERWVSGIPPHLSVDQGDADPVVPVESPALAAQGVELLQRGKGDGLLA